MDGADALQQRNRQNGGGPAMPRECPDTAPAHAETGRRFGLSLRRNFSWTLAGHLVYAACQWGMLVVLAKLGTPVAVGQFALALAVTAPVVMFANLNLRAVQATDARRDYQFGDYLALRLVTAAPALLVIGGIVIASRYRLDTALVILAIGIAKTIESLSDIFYGLLQQHERMDRVAMSMIIKGPLSLVMLSAVFYLTKNVLWGSVGLAAAWALVLVSYDLRSGKMVLRMAQQAEPGAPKGNPSLNPRWHPRTLARLAWLSLPLGVVMLLYSLNSSIPLYFVERYLGERQLGVFSAVAYFTTAGALVMSALGQSASPRLADHYASGRQRAFGALVLRLVVIGVVMGAAGLLVARFGGERILTVIYRAEYARHTDILCWLMVAAGFTYVASMLGYAATARRRLHLQPVAAFAVAAVSAVACCALVPVYGLQGAAVAVVASALTSMLAYSLLAFLGKEEA